MQISISFNESTGFIYTTHNTTNHNNHNHNHDHNHNKVANRQEFLCIDFRQQFLPNRSLYSALAIDHIGYQIHHFEKCSSLIFFLSETKDNDITNSIKH